MAIAMYQKSAHNYKEDCNGGSDRQFCQYNDNFGQ